MKIINIYVQFLIFILCITACKKDPEIIPPLSNQNSTIAEVDPTDFTCITFPQWFHAPPDSVTYPTMQAMYWQYVPGDKSKAVYYLGGQIWSYDFISKQRVLIGNNRLYEPSCNSRGWVVYSDFVDYCVYKVKINGDSLTRLTYDGGTDAHWDYTDTCIYYYNEQVNKLYKINSYGKKLDSINSGPGLYTAYSKKENKVYYGRFENGVPSLICLNLSTKQETIIGKYIVGYITIDNNDENIYFMDFNTTNNPILKYNILSQKTDTLFKSCDSHLFSWPHISAKTNQLTIACIFTKFLDPKTDLTIKKANLLRWTKTFEMDLNDPAHKLKEVNLFP